MENLYLCDFLEHSGDHIKGFCEICVYLDERFVVLERCLESVIEMLLTSLGVFELLTELCILILKRASDEVDRCITGVFEVSVRDVDIAIKA